MIFIEANVTIMKFDTVLVRSNFRILNVRKIFYIAKNAKNASQS